MGTRWRGVAWAAALMEFYPEARRRADAGAGRLDCALWFKDDGWAGGDIAALARYLDALRVLGPPHGVTLSERKLEIVLPAGAPPLTDPRVFAASQPLAAGGAPAPPPLAQGNFSLLGAAIGSAAYGAACVAERVEAARALLAAVVAVDDPQLALRLVSRCCSFGKLSFLARVAPFPVGMEQFQEFDEAVRRAFEELSGVFPSPAQWRRATFPVRHGGLGLRGVAPHAAAACVASLTASHEGCVALDPAYGHGCDAPGSPFSLACAALSRVVPALFPDDPTLPTEYTQRRLSDRLEGRWLEELRDGAPPDRATLHWQLCARPGAGAWLNVMPSIDLGQAFTPAAFAVLLRRRLGIPVYAHEDHCPACQAVCDCFGDHAVACPAGGGRTRRHRDELAALAASAGHAPSTEVPHLLPDRPTLLLAPEDGSAPAQGAAAGRRRPADVYLPG